MARTFKRGEAPVSEEMLREIKERGVARFASIRVEESEEGEKKLRSSFSSEEPYERWFGIEILSHEPDAIRLGDRAKDGLPLLIGHDSWTLPVGRIENIEIVDKKLQGDLRFGVRQEALDAKAETEAKIVKETSIGYIVHAMEKIKEEEDMSTFLVTDWEPLEGSLVAVPADPTVGVGRKHETQKGEREMPPEEEKVETTPTAEEPKVDIKAEREEARAEERKRSAEIRAIGDYMKMEDQAEKAVAEGTPVSDFHLLVAEKMKENGPLKDAKIDMGPDLKRYSLFKAIKAAASKDWSNAGLELEASQEVAKRMGREPRGFFVPDGLDWRSPAEMSKRDMTVGTDSAGGYLVADDHLAGNFIEMLRNKSVVAQTGAFILDGLVGNVEIPKQTGGATFYWIDNEAEDTTESALTLGQVALSPKTVSGRIDLTRRLMLQSSPAAEALVRSDFARGCALAVDLAAINGSGASGQPTGILQVSGIGAVAGGTNGLAPTWAHMVSLETEVSQDNADIGTLAYVTNSKVRGKLKVTEKASNTAAFIWGESNTLNGYNAPVSNQVPSNLTKGSASGVCSAIIFGNWADLIIGMWGALDIKADEVTLGDRGGLVLRVFQDIDIAVRHAESFAAMVDALTA